MQNLKCFYLLTALLAALTTAFPQGVYQHLNIFMKASKNLNWNLLREHLLKLKSAKGADLCLEKIAYSLNHFFSDSTMSDLLMYSGKAVFDQGDYLGCIKTNSSYYLRINLRYSRLYHMFAPISLCLPKECSVNYFNANRKLILEVVSDFLGMELEDEDLQFDNVKQVNQELNRVGLGLMLFVLLTLGMVIAVVLATVLDSYDKLGSGTTTHQMLLAFSLKKNLRNLMSNENRIDVKLNVFNGIRVLAISWVIYNHSWLIFPYEALLDMQHAVAELPFKVYMVFAKTGPLAVDIFFVLSGFFASFVLCSSFQNPKRRTFTNGLLAILNRFLRFFPFLFVALCLSTLVLPATGDTPTNVVVYQLLSVHCEQQWFLTLTHLNNLVSKFSTMCMGWTWYLNADFQFFVIAVPLIILYLKSKRRALLVMAIITMISFAITAFLSYYYDLHKSYVKPSHADFSTIYMDKPYTRISTYFMGMLLYFMYDDSKKEEGTEYLPFKSLQKLVYNSKVVRYTGYVLGFAIIFIIISSSYFVDNYHEYYGQVLSILDVTFGRPLFTFGLCLFLYPVLIGRATIFHSIFSFPIFAPLGKLTFGTYILHLVLLIFFLKSRLESMYYSAPYYIFRVAGIIFVGYAFSFVVSLIYEVPCMQIQKLFLGRPQTKSTSTEVKALVSKS